MSDAVLSLNAGSSSLKFALFEVAAAGDPQPTVRGEIEGIGTAPHLVARDHTGRVLTERRWPDGASMAHEAFFGALFDWIEHHLGGDELIGVGHRIVHGGARFDGPALASDAVMTELAALSPLAPLHQPHNLAAVRAAQAVRPHLPQIVAFDTAFHRTQPVVATRFALPRALTDAGVRRYGFHGLSYEYVARTLAGLDPEMARGRIVAAHLGNGASLCALSGGVSLDSTMGFTAVDGLVMGTRCGSLDPGVLLYLIQSHGYSGEAIEDLIYRRSGMLGVSGLSSDMRTLLASHDPHAAEAVELFVYQIGRQAAALAGSLGGLDGLVFTAGIGEHAAAIRAAACARLSWLGVEIAADANAAGAAVISAPASRVKVRVLPTDEERMIAIHTLEILDNSELRQIR
ncbi:MULTISPECIES: acetate/propionate family kinase [unclassified Methylobacterium]|jgi:acetate kinase|uniref:acetate/propionate family kinase n=1 Tax=unclassified Methylobacterium TaxID=2615210 RepID=UPI001354FC3F|nr:acetate/propionate family kinase [Methylobacterium sp. 2A]MWV24985.1 acetate/propionate family kinase [Methylobacterium sp. 2A]